MVDELGNTNKLLSYTNLEHISLKILLVSIRRYKIFLGFNNNNYRICIHLKFYKLKYNVKIYSSCFFLSNFGRGIGAGKFKRSDKFIACISDLL